MAEAVVDELEAVEVEEEHGHPRPGSIASLEGVLDPVGEQPAVGQAGQRVGQRGADEPLMDGGVFERDRHVVGEKLDQLQVLVVELAVDPVEVQGADHAIGAAYRRDDQ